MSVTALTTANRDAFIQTFRSAEESPYSAAIAVTTYKAERPTNFATLTLANGTAAFKAEYPTNRPTDGPTQSPIIHSAIMPSFFEAVTSALWSSEVPPYDPA